MVDKLVINVEGELNHLGSDTRMHHNIIQGTAHRQLLAILACRHLKQITFLTLEVSGQNRSDPLLCLLRQNIGHEAKRTPVDAYHGYTMLRHQRRDLQHTAISTDNND